jgi:hypothetical protein
MHDESNWDGKDVERKSVIKCFITENMIGISGCVIGLERDRALKMPQCRFGLKQVPEELAFDVSVMGFCETEGITPLPGRAARLTELGSDIRGAGIVCGERNAFRSVAFASRKTSFPN